MITEFNPTGYTPFAVVPKVLSPEWKAWIGENIILGNDPNKIVSTLIAHGLDRYSAQREVLEALHSPYIQAERRQQLSKN